MRCLLVIDVQNGFVSEKTQFIVPKIIQVMDLFTDELIIATKFINRPGSGFMDIMHWKRLSKSPEIDVLGDIEKKATLIAEKYVYSACTEEILSQLRKNSINEVYIAGIDTDCCVLKTAIDLFELNIRPIVMSQYCASNGGTKSHQAAIEVLKRTIGIEQIYDGEMENV